MGEGVLGGWGGWEGVKTCQAAKWAAPRKEPLPMSGAGLPTYAMTQAKNLLCRTKRAPVSKYLSTRCFVCPSVGAVSQAACENIEYF